ncbi:phosphatidylserine decarboxylase family protein [Reichenbachiella versicolor]|uniref:phosphatidylserine decarboxylase family protein n=1 Tax=Reichenbachiella versicolor TaxID=1821036 RepID=UPI000D6E986F|nr:phosphatidylserine decarboxylase family protein [Reichenbachiella versicolor]
MTIHKEGKGILLSLFIILGGLNAFLYSRWPDMIVIRQAVGLVSLILYLLVLQFFRNPKIKVQVNTNEILAPAEGKVVVIEEVEEPEYFKDKRIQMSIFMSPLNVHVCRTPIGGLVKYMKYHAGKYLVAWHPKSSTENERTTMVVEHESGAEILVRQVAGAVARRIKWYPKEGDKLADGDEYGFIKFGSRLDIYMPLGTEITVNIDDKTKGGKTVIAKLN